MDAQNTKARNDVPGAYTSQLSSLLCMLSSVEHPSLPSVTHVGRLRTSVSSSCCRPCEMRSPVCCSLPVAPSMRSRWPALLVL